MAVAVLPFAAHSATCNQGLSHVFNSRRACRPPTQACLTPSLDSLVERKDHLATALLCLGRIRLTMIHQHDEC